MKIAINFNLITGLLLFSLSLHSQQLDLYQTNATIEPQRMGGGLFIHLVEGDNLMTRGLFEQAILSYDNALAQDPYFAEGYIKRALAKYRLGRKTEAHQDYDKAYRINPYAADLYGYQNHSRKLRVMAFDPIQALTLFEESSEYEKEDDIAYQLLQKSIELKMNGDAIGALQNIEEAISINSSKDPVLLKLRGNIHLLLGNYMEAIEDYSVAIRTNPNLTEAYHNRAIAKILAYNRPDACMDFQKSAEMGCIKSEEKLKYFCGF